MTPTTHAHRDLENPSYVQWRDFLRHADDWDADQVEAFQLSELNRVVAHAVEQTRAYRELYAGMTIKLGSCEDARKLPFVTKELIRDRLSDFTAGAPEGDYVATGGSTGVPFGFHRDKGAFAKELASKAHQYARIGWAEGDRQLVLRGLVLNEEDHMELVPDVAELRCSSYHLTDSQMDRYRLRALRYEPRWLKCYPSSGYIFARFLERTGGDLPPIQGVLCASENLYDFQKELLQRVFRGRVFSHYGHYELSALAGYCESEDTYHVLPQYGFVELLRGDVPVTQPGEAGEIVATSFIMSATPFIRYRTGDWAVFQGHGCESCGRPYQVWSRIEGREQELAVTATGRYILMTAVNMHDGVFDHVLQFQFHQVRRGEITFGYVPRDTCTEGVVAQMRQRLGVKLGDDMRILMQPVDKIELTKRGKHTFLVQDLPVSLADGIL
jgi:phenylacetate-CoA ligase